MTRQRYCVDTSALIDGLERYYPEENFPMLWERIDTLVAERRFFISEEVLEELREKDEPASEWAEARLELLVIPTDSNIMRATRGVLTGHPLLVKNMKNRNRADPFVIGVASLYGATVVTGEGSDGSANRPKIPYVCDQIGVECIRFLELIQNEGWSF